MGSDITIFEKIISREIPTKIIFENDWALAFHDINPQAPTHVLVIPKRKVKTFTELAEHSPEAVGLYVRSIAEVAAQLGLDARGYRVVFNCGENGQQTVAYLHAHILGERQMRWPPG